MPKTLKELEAARAALDKAIADEKTRTANYTSVMKLAEMLHDTTCKSNHIDMCGWGYEGWDGWTHQRYLKNASELMLRWTSINPSDPDFCEKLQELLVIMTKG